MIYLHYYGSQVEDFSKVIPIILEALLSYFKTKEYKLV